MSNIVVLGFKDEAAADAFGEKIAKLQSDKALDIDDLVKVTVDADGRHKLHYIFSPTRGAAIAGSILGQARQCCALRDVREGQARRDRGGACGFASQGHHDDTLARDRGRAQNGALVWGF